MSEQDSTRTLRENVLDQLPAIMIVLVGLIIFSLALLRWFGLYNGFDPGTGLLEVLITAIIGLEVMFVGFVLAKWQWQIQSWGWRR